MCHLVASLDKTTIPSLVEAGLSRGNTSHSYCRFELNALGEPSRAYTILRKNNPLNLDSLTVDLISDKKRYYHIIHTQAPTGAFGQKYGIHPAYAMDLVNVVYLWHNGILLDVRDKWDTQHMADTISKQWRKRGKGIVKTLSEFKGSFACILYYNGFFYCFRNNAAPLYAKDTTLSSLEFPGSKMIKPCMLYTIDFNDTNSLTEFKEFNNNEDPFYFT